VSSEKGYCLLISYFLDIGACSIETHEFIFQEKKNGITVLQLGIQGTENSSVFLGAALQDLGADETVVGDRDV
jgi:hypothetical protein